MRIWKVIARKTGRPTFGLAGLMLAMLKAILEHPEKTLSETVKEMTEYLSSCEERYLKHLFFTVASFVYLHKFGRKNANFLKERAPFIFLAVRVNVECDSTHRAKYAC